jgi:hypothetical protein
MIGQRGVVRFLWEKDMAAKDIHKEMLPVYGEHCLSLLATLYNIFRGNAFLTTTRLKEQCTTRISRRRFPGACETVGQVFKFVRRSL